MTGRDQEEYTALRATIRERGTARVLVFAAGLAIWAALVIATTALALAPVAAIVPLVALVATFEAVLALHVGVERIGRYLLAFHNDEWERVAGAFGRPARAIAVDPLFSVPFLVATLVNLTPLLAVDAIPQEWIFVGGAHALFAVRVVVARAAAMRQRDVDAERFNQLRR